MKLLPIGTRVQAASGPNIGKAFRGQFGTVVEHVDSVSHHVDFDFVDKPGDFYANGGTWGPDALIPAPGTTIDTPELVALLPLGTTLRDSDGWIHTKIAEEYGSDDTTSYTSPGGESGTFGTCWACSSSATRFFAVLAPEPTLEELKASLEAARTEAAPARNDAEAPEPNYTSLADEYRELRADYDRTRVALDRESKILAYAKTLLGNSKRAQVRGYTEAL
jgi:hypothetical protein